MKHSSRSLTTMIILVIAIFLLFLASVSTYGVIGQITNRKQQQEFCDTIADLYLNDISNDLEKINYQLLALLIDDDNIRMLRENKLEDPVTIDNLKKGAITTIYSSFADYAKQFDLACNYFFICDKYDLSLGYIEASYPETLQVRECIQELTIEKIHAEKPVLKWFYLKDADCLMTVYTNSDMYIGCYIMLKDIASNLRAISDYEFSYIALLEQDNTIYEETTVNDKTGVRYSYDLEGSEIKVILEMDNSHFHDARVMQIIMTVIILISAVGAVLILIGTQRFIIRPVNQFYRSMLGQEADNSIMAIREFEAASHQVFALSEENVGLREKVYEEQMKLKQIEFDHAHLQFRPHFFINCLNSIFVMAQLKRYEDIQRFTRYVSDYVRGMFQKAMVLIPLANEVKMVQDYLEIQELMYNDRIDFSLQCPEELLQIKVPPLVIESFVENSLKYGFRDDNLCQISITISSLPNHMEFLQIQIQDNGKGFDPAILQQLNEKGEIQATDGKMIGINNVLQRLDMIYEGKARVTFSNLQDGGASIDLCLPKHAEREGNEPTGS